MIANLLLGRGVCEACLEGIDGGVDGGEVTLQSKVILEVEGCFVKSSFEAVYLSQSTAFLPP
jgi:hypothetical protein